MFFDILSKKSCSPEWPFYRNLPGLPINLLGSEGLKFSNAISLPNKNFFEGEVSKFVFFTISETNLSAPVLNDPNNIGYSWRKCCV